MGLPAGLLDLGYTRALRPLLFAAHDGDPEAIHEDLIALLAGPGSAPSLRSLIGLLAASKGRATTVAGIDFPNRVGLAAGLDKDASAVLAWQGLGFGFAELGTVTAHGQPGNPRPRVFRLRASKALLNRMGFNNPGAEAVAATLAARGVSHGNRADGIPIGLSIGKTKATPLDAAVEDYLTSLRLLAPHADYVAVNVSSPNTPGLRTLQDGGALAELLTALVEQAKRDAAPTGSGADRPAGSLPIFVKVAPDLTWGQLDEVLSACTEAGAAGVIATNTTLTRDGLAASDQGLAAEAGGLSGAPLARRAREVVGYVASHTELPVIGVGGIMTASDASALFDAGAALVQLYTGFIYGGPGLIAAINAHDLGRAGE